MKLKKLLTLFMAVMLILSAVTVPAYAEEANAVDYPWTASDDFTSYSASNLKDFTYEAGKSYGTGFDGNWSDSPTGDGTVATDSTAAYKDLYTTSYPLDIGSAGGSIYRKLENSIDFSETGKKYTFSFNLQSGAANQDFRFILGGEDLYFGFKSDKYVTDNKTYWNSYFAPQLVVGDDLQVIPTEFSDTDFFNGDSSNKKRYNFELTVILKEGRDTLKVRYWPNGSSAPNTYNIKEEAELSGFEAMDYIGFYQKSKKNPIWNVSIKAEEYVVLSDWTATDDFTTYGVSTTTNLSAVDNSINSCGSGFGGYWSDTPRGTGVASSCTASLLTGYNNKAGQYPLSLGTDNKIYRNLPNPIDFSETGKKYTFSFSIQSGAANQDFRFILGGEDLYFGFRSSPYENSSNNKWNTSFVPQLVVGDEVKVNTDALTYDSSKPYFNGDSSTNNRYTFELTVILREGEDTLKVRYWRANTAAPTDYNITQEVELSSFGEREYIGFEQTGKKKEPIWNVSVKAEKIFMFDYNIVSAEAKDVTIYVAIYEGDTLKDVISTPIKLKEGPNTGSFGFDGTTNVLPQASAGKTLTAKAFVWDDELCPIMKSVPLE